MLGSLCSARSCEMCESSCAVMLVCIRLYMGSIVTAVTMSGIRKFIPLEGCADIGHLANIPKHTRAAKYLAWEAAVFQISGSFQEQAQPSHGNVSEQENAIKIIRVKFWLLVNFQEER